jgi:hypothetical protein
MKFATTFAAMMIAGMLRFRFDGQMTPPTGNACGELSSNPNAFGVGHFTLKGIPEASTWR